MRAEQHSFWDAEEARPPRVAEMHVEHATQADCNEFTGRYHYSGHASMTLWRYGLWHDVTLWGIAGYNQPTRQTGEMLFGADYGQRVAHLSRLALAEHAPLNAESRLVAGSLRLLTRDKPEFLAVLTYADPLEDHIGWIYQATNALYTGTSIVSPRYVTPEGTIRGTYDGAFISRTEATRRGWSIIEGKAKHRYLYLLGSKTQRQWARRHLKIPVLPYPKS